MGDFMKGVEKKKGGNEIGGRGGVLIHLEFGKGTGRRKWKRNGKERDRAWCD